MKKLLVIILISFFAFTVINIWIVFIGIDKYANFVTELKGTPPEKSIEGHPELSSKIKECISKNEICIGMTTEQVIKSWGKPDDISKTVGPSDVNEQWVYYRRRNNGTYYLYFRNGIMNLWSIN